MFKVGDKVKYTCTDTYSNPFIDRNKIYEIQEIGMEDGDCTLIYLVGAGLGIYRNRVSLVSSKKVKFHK